MRELYPEVGTRYIDFSVLTVATSPFLTHLCKTQKKETSLMVSSIGINASVTSNSTLGIAATTHTGSRMLYYQDLNATIHELNNTDFNGTHGSLSEGWVSYASTDVKKGNTSFKAGGDARGLDVVQAMSGTKMSVSMGFRGKTNQLFLFYQQNGSDITVLVRDEGNISGWDGGKALELGG